MSNPNTGGTATVAAPRTTNVQSGTMSKVLALVTLAIMLDGKPLREVKVRNWSPAGGFPLKEREIASVELTTEEEGKVTLYVGEEVSANKKLLRNPLAKADEVVDDEALILPTKAKLGEAKYPHILRTEDGNPVIIYGESEAQRKFGFLIRDCGTGEVHRKWTSDIHQSFYTEATKKKMKKAK